MEYFLHLAPKIYNLIPESYKMINSISKFKKKIKKWLLEIGIEETEKLLLIQN